VKTYASDDRRAAFVSLERGEDLMDGLNRAVAELAYRAATVQVIGGLDEAALGFFDPESGQYVTTRTGHVEISAGLGNVSIRDGAPFIHMHLTVSDREGRCVGGHAMDGCIAYVVEAYLRVLEGDAPVRQEVPGMHLKVWPGR
jgi:predicted DNA-binding protein with PD1-like motif